MVLHDKTWLMWDLLFSFADYEESELLKKTL